MKPICDVKLAFAFPGSLDTPTGGYRYDRRVIAELRGVGITIETLQLPDGFPNPSEADLRRTAAQIAASSTDWPIVIDGLALGAMPADIAAGIAVIRPLIALVHHPLALETGLAPDRAALLRASERAALAYAQAIVVTSPTTADLLVAGYAVDGSRIAIALPGVDPAGVDCAASRYPGATDAPIRFLTVGSLIPRKGHLDLIAALDAIRDLDWTAEIVGDGSLDPDHATNIAAVIVARGLCDRIALTGALDETELAARYRTADCFVLATHYEGYGMAFTEAIACGLPVIGTTGAAHAIGTGGVLVAPGDVADLARWLRAVASHASVRAELAERARRRASDLPRWSDTARVIADVVRALA